MRDRRAPRLQDVAERAGVSLATASRSLSGSVGVSDEVAAHVRSVAEQLGYMPNLHARTLAGGRTSVAGLVVYEIGDPYFAEIASGVVHVAAQNGWSVQISHTEREPVAEAAQIRLLRAHRVGAIVIAGSGYVDAAMEEESGREVAAFEESGGRVVVVGRHHLRCDAVLPDNEAAGESVAQHLLELGHRRLAVAAGPGHLTTIVDRLAGIRTALARYGLDADAVPVVHAPFTREGGRDAARRLLAENPRTTAVLALNDAMATGVLSLLRERGIAVPHDVSVTGFDDIQVAQDLAPALTTVRLPMSEIGAASFELALRPPSARLRRRTTGHALVVRDSTAAPVARD
ncbi:LacI family DNA-binding transcriptional regulator [Cellulosimicrobium marinum]|uniref:LacI family DNA-binding transcriptional regulator n=1 Tax=Cellulosimicrobium marinum TaxID=1638992 RepID=UPI001E33F38E|nr:LacI family DNA-binding transcriptional regulator [Cellulosimicrobium marinum]MCB7137938.1 LacI family transcriptional regulator [Cellulosimicrobium marinum]